MKFFKNKTLNRNIPIPLYYQLKEILLEYIKEHHEDEELPIPTEKEISEHFGISRPTVRQAINELVVEGYLYRQKAKGTFVSKPKIKQDFLLILDSFENEMLKKGLQPSTKLLNIETVNSDEKVSKALNVPLESKVIKLTRLRFANNEPIVLVVTYLPYDQCKGIISRDLEKESMYDIIENVFGYRIAGAHRTLESIVAGEYEAKLLAINKGAPIQYFESVAYLVDNTPIEYSLAKYRGDRNKFTFELKRDGHF